MSDSMQFISAPCVFTQPYQQDSCYRYSSGDGCSRSFLACRPPRLLPLHFEFIEIDYRQKNPLEYSISA